MPIAGIAFIFIAVIRRYRSARTQPFRRLLIITAFWLLITFSNRLAMSAPARNYIISAAMEQYAATHRESFYFAAIEWLWTAEQIMILAFGIALFFALRGHSREHI